MIRAAAWFLCAFSISLGIMAVALILKWPIEVGVGVILGTGLLLISTVTFVALKDDSARQASGGSRGTSR